MDDEVGATRVFSRWVFSGGKKKIAKGCREIGISTNSRAESEGACLLRENESTHCAMSKFVE